MSGRIALATCSDLPDGDPDDEPLVRGLEALGFEVAYVVWDDERVAWERFDACLIRTTWDYAFARPRFVAWARRTESRTRLFHGADLVEWNTDKRYLEEFHELGIPIVPTHWLERSSRPDLASLLESFPGRTAFLKPAVGATSRETLRFDRDAQGLRAAQAHVARLLPEEDLLLQPYLDSVERDGELSAIFIDGQFTHGVRKVPVRGDYRVQDEFGAQDTRHEFTPEEVELAGRVLRPLGRAWLYARVDFLRGDEGELLLNELEVVEPSLFFRHAPEAAQRLARALVERLH